MSRRAVDSQRAKVYAWERANIPGFTEGQWRPEVVRRFKGNDGVTRAFHRQRCRIDAEWPLADCAKLVHRIWGDYRPGAVPPRVDPGHLARRATGWRDRINLPRWARQGVVVIHETTHSLLPPLRWKVDHAGRECVIPVAWHGPEFVRLYIELLLRYHRPARGQRAHLLRTARAARIKVGRLQDCPKPRTRTTRPAV